jgi:hypothetical protein
MISYPSHAGDLCSIDYRSPSFGKSRLALLRLVVFFTKRIGSYAVRKLKRCNCLLRLLSSDSNIPNVMPSEADIAMPGTVYLNKIS